MCMLLFTVLYTPELLMSGSQFLEYVTSSVVTPSADANEISFLRHLANMSSMDPFWASTDSVFVPNWGPRPKPCRPEEVVYIRNDSCSHFTQCLSLRNFLSNIHVLLITIPLTLFILIIHHIHTSNYNFYLHDICIHVFTFPDSRGRQAALGPLCPIHKVPKS
jgi:hypothetical protein